MRELSKSPAAELRVSYILLYIRLSQGDVESGRVWWGGGQGLDSQAAVMISHSLPDLSRSVSQELLLPHDNKKVREGLWQGGVGLGWAGW